MGEEPKRALYQYLLSIHSVRTEDIPLKVGEFITGIRRALGAASKVIEKLILKRLYEKIGSTFHESQGLGFADYVEEARQMFSVQSSTSIDAESGATRSKKGEISG